MRLSICRKRSIVLASLSSLTLPEQRVSARASSGSLRVFSEYFGCVSSPTARTILSGCFYCFPCYGRNWRAPGICHISSLDPMGARRWPVFCQRRNIVDQAFVAMASRTGWLQNGEGLEKKKYPSTNVVITNHRLDLMTVRGWPVFCQRRNIVDQAFVARYLIHPATGRVPSKNSSSGVILIRRAPVRQESFARIGILRTSFFGAILRSDGVAMTRTCPTTPTEVTQMSKKHNCLLGFCSKRQMTACCQRMVHVASSIYKQLP